MDSAPLGGRRKAAGGFALDRPVGLLFLALFAARVLLTVWGVGYGWHKAGGSALNYLDARWWVHARYLTETMAEFWMGVGLMRGRRWSMIGLAFLYLAWLVGSVHGLVTYGPSWFELAYFSIESLVLVYVAMRLAGSLGPRPDDPVDPVGPSLLNRLGAGVGFVLLAISILMIVDTNVRGYREAQYMGAIEPLPYVASHGWGHATWLAWLAFEVWSLLAIGRGRPWAFLILALLSLGWLFRPIHTGDTFYIVSNGLMLLYCVARLVGLRGRRPSSEAGIVAG